VHVRGTVFSVAAGAGRTEVRVYEGAVMVASAAGERVLQEGESYASDRHALTRGDDAPLQHEAASMAQRRARAAATAGAAARPAAASPLPAPEPAGVNSTDGTRVAEALVPANPTAPARVRAAEAHVEEGAQQGESLQQARAWLHDGQAERALSAARRARTDPSAPRGDWLLLQADALRSLGRARDAALAYREAAFVLPGEGRARAGFKAADILLRELDDPRAALAALAAAGVDGPSSALRERGLLLRIEALQRLGEPVAEAAARYLDEYPDSAGAPRLRALIEGAR
jgi:hypothetical protein